MASVRFTDPAMQKANVLVSSILRFCALGMCGGVFVLAGCGGSTPSVQVESGNVGVDAFDNLFRRAEIRVERGTEVVWTNKGRSDHDVMPVASDGRRDEWGVGPDEFGPDATYAHRFTEPGTYEYYCTLHGTKTKGMVGTEHVEK